MTDNNFNDQKKEMNENSFNPIKDNSSDNLNSNNNNNNLNNNSNNEIQNSEANFSNYDSTQRQNSNYPSNQISNQSFKNKKPIGLWVGLGFLVVIVILVVSFGLNTFWGKSNALNLLSSISKSYDFKQLDIYQEIAVDNLDIDANDKNTSYVNLLNSIKFNMHSKLDTEKNILESDAKVYLKDVKVLSMLFQLNNNDYIVSIPELTKKSIYFSPKALNEITDQKNSDAFEKVSEAFSSDKVKKAMEIYKTVPSPRKMKSFKKLESKKHFDNMLKHFDSQIVKEDGSRVLSVDDKDVEFKGSMYTVTYNSEDFVFYYNSLKDLCMDENFKPFVEEYLDNVIKVAEKNQDLVLYNYFVLLNKPDSLEDIKTEWDDDIKGELLYMKESILDGIDKLQEVLNRPSFAQDDAKIINILSNSGIQIVSTYIVDKKLRYADYKFKLDGKKLKKTIGNITNVENDDISINNFEFHTSMGFLAFDKDVTFKDFNKDDAIDYIKADPKDIKELNNEIQNNVLKLIFSLNLF